MSGDPIDLDAIEARAKAIPDGWGKWADWHHYQILSLVTPTKIDGWAYPEKRADAIERTEAAVEHIAGMDPATTLALVAEVRRLSDTVERVEWLRRSTAMDCDIDGGYCDMHGVETDEEGRCGLVAMLDRALSP